MLYNWFSSKNQGKTLLIAIQAAVCCILLISTFSPAALGQSKPKDILATIEGRPLTADEFIAEFNRQVRGKSALGSDPAQMRKLLRDMVQVEALAAAARKSKYDQKPEVQKALRQFLARSFKTDAIGQRLRDVSVSSKEVEDYYASHPEEFSIPPRLRVALIRLDFSAKWPREKQDEQLNRARTAREEALKLGPDMRSFGEVAVRYSVDQASRYRGGEIGWISRQDKGNSLDQAVVEAVFSLAQPGDISPIITAADGLYLARLMERSPGSQRLLAQVREAVAARIAEEKRNKIEEDFTREAEKTANVIIDEKKFQSLAEELSARMKAAPSPSPDGGPPALPVRQ